MNDHINYIALRHERKYVVRRAVAFLVIASAFIWFLLKAYTLFVYFCWAIGIT